MSVVSVNIDIGNTIKELVNGIIKFSPNNGLKRRWIGEHKRELRVKSIQGDDLRFESYNCHKKIENIINLTKNNDIYEYDLKDSVFYAKCIECEVFTKFKLWNK